LIKAGAKPEATYLAWLDVGGVADKIGAKKLAAAANSTPQGTNPFTNEPIVATQADMVSHWFAKNAYVFLESGTGFGKGGENHLRMNIATTRGTLKAALDSMAAALKNLA
jgi:bifunctional pyridoxal-dependent enzyme with beta-cystathionase and maltose regulon repressor activities